MEYAVISTGGKQYKVKNGDILEVENLKTDKKSFIFDSVLLVVSDNGVNIGKPNVAGATVSAKIIGNVKGAKIRVSKFLAKSKYRRTTGHRQNLTRIQIEGINLANKKADGPDPLAKKSVKKPSKSAQKIKSM